MYESINQQSVSRTAHPPLKGFLWEGGLVKSYNVSDIMSIRAKEEMELDN